MTERPGPIAALRVARHRIAAAALLVMAAAPMVLAAQASAQVASGNPERGVEVFLVCSGCHAATPAGGALIGPNLWGIVDRPVASVPGFDYSAELRSVGGAWTRERLDRFLTEPQAFAPGTRMGLGGVAVTQDRADLIAYLATLSGEAGQAGAPPATDFGPDWPPGPGQAETGTLCNSCHSLAIVKQQQLSRSTWDKLLVWMVEEQGMPEQQPERRELILDYLSTHFGSP